MVGFCTSTSNNTSQNSRGILAHGRKEDKNLKLVNIFWEQMFTSSNLNEHKTAELNKVLDTTYRIQEEACIANYRYTKWQYIWHCHCLAGAEGGNLVGENFFFTSLKGLLTVTLHGHILDQGWRIELEHNAKLQALLLKMWMQWRVQMSDLKCQQQL